MSHLTGKPAPSWTLNQDSEAFISSYQLQKAFAILRNVRSILDENSKHRSKAFNIEHVSSAPLNTSLFTQYVASDYA